MCAFESWVGYILLIFQNRGVQVLDVWTYDVVRNWGHTKSSFLLVSARERPGHQKASFFMGDTRDMFAYVLQAFEKSTYPVKTNQGYWMVSLINFHIDSIMKSRVSRVMLLM